MSDIDVDPDVDPSNFIRRQQQASMSYALGSLEDDPEKAARATQLADVTGDNPSLILPNLENYEQQHKAALTAQLLKSNKYLRQYIDANPIHAKISSDGYASLDDISESMKKVYPGPSVVLNSAIDRAIQGYKEGAIQGGGIGDWAFLSPDAREHPLKAAIAGVGWAPIEIAMRFGSGVFRAVTEATYGGVKAGAQQFGVDESHADSMAREAAGVIESEMLGTRAHEAPRPTLGQHIEALPKEAKPTEFADKTASQIDKALAIFIKAKPWLDEGKVPPKGLDPDIDKALFEQNKLGLDNLDEAYKKVQSDPTHERNEDISAYYLRLHGDSDIGISGDAVARLYGDKVPEIGDNILGWHPGLPEELEMAKATGGDVRFPASELLAKTKPEVWDQLKDDIRVYPHGITKNEVVAEREAKVGLAEPPKPAEIIPEPLPSVRGSAGLEPVYSIGDRKLNLEKIAGQEPSLDDPSIGADRFNLVDETGRRRGWLRVVPFEDGKKLYVDNIAGVKGANSFGNYLTRDIARQLKQEYPQAEQIGGFRISGARERAGTEREVWIKFDDLVGPDGWTHVPGLRDILSESDVDVGHSTLRYSKELSPHAAAADKLIRDTLARIAPSAQVFTPSSILRSDRSGATRAGFMQPFKEQNPWIVIALESPESVGTTRHEAIHLLRQFGFFSEDEWFNLIRAAKENDWVKKYLANVEDSYAHLPESGKLEEAIARAYHDWGNGVETPKYLHPIFEKLKEFFDRLKTGLREILGREPTWQEVFEKVESGEVGAREPTGHAGGAFLETKASDEPAFGKGAVTTVERQKLYDKLIADRHAEDLKSAMARAEAEQRKTQTAEWKENAKAVRTEVDESIRNRPDVAADLFFGAGELYGTKVSKKVKLGSVFLTDEQKARLPKDYIAKDGMNPDDLAGLFGYQSGDTLVNHLGDYNAAKLAAGMSAKDFVTRATDIETQRQMQLRYGQLEQSILEHATEQAQSETQLNLLHEETYRLATEAGLNYTITKEQLRSSVQEQFDNTPMKALDPERFRASMEKANKAIELGLLKEKPTEAYQAAQQKELAFIMWKEATALEKAKGQFDKIARRYQAREVTGATPEYTDAVHDILMRLGQRVNRSVQDLQESFDMNGYKSLGDFVAVKETQLRDLHTPDWLQDPNFRKSVEDLTAREFEEVHNAIKAITFNSRDEKKVIKAGEKHDFEVVLDEMVEKMKSLGPAKVHPIDTTGRKVGDYVKSWWWAGINVESMLNRLDRDDPRGVFYQYITHHFTEASNYRDKLIKKYQGQISELGKIEGLDKKIDNDLFKDPLTGEAFPMRRRNVLGILQQVGNEININKLAKGYGLKPEQVMQWLAERTTKEDWDRAQKIGDMFNEIFDMANEMSHHISGVGIQRRPLKPIETPFGTYPGFYNPIKYDPLRPGTSKRLMGPNPLEEEGMYKATTPQGYTKDVTGYIAPVELNLDVVPQRMKQMLHDIAMRPAVLQMSKFFYDNRFERAMTAHYGVHQAKEMIPFLRDIANAPNFKSMSEQLGQEAIEYFRQNTIATLIGFNPATVAKHGATAWANSMTEVGSLNFLREFKNIVAETASGQETWKMTFEKSEEIQRRMRNFQELFAGHGSEINIRGSRSRFMSLRDIVTSAGATPVSISDLMSAVPTWAAKYKEEIANGTDEGLAVSLANRAVRRAHGSAIESNKPSIARTNALGATFSSLYGFFSHMQQKQYELSWKAHDYLLGDKSGDPNTSRHAPDLLRGFMSYVVFPALVEELVTPSTNDEYKSWGRKAAEILGMGVSSSFIGVRDFVRAVINVRDPQAGLIGTSLKAGTDLARDLQHGSQAFNRDKAGNIIKHTFALSGVLSGLTNAQEGKTAEYMYRWGQGLEKPKGPWDMAVGLRYGKTQGHTRSFDEWLKHH